MTPQESARAKSVWAAKVVALFVFAGGAVGGAAVGLLMSVMALAASPDHYLSLDAIVQFPVALLLMSLFGLAFGLPPSALTGATYVIGAGSMRKRRRLVGFGIAVSALWGALLMELMTSYPTPVESYFTMAMVFAFAGGVATLACFSLLVRLRLKTPA